ncbi:LysR family transcriptional regulator [Paracoccus sp. S1E-3]|uniref:LysR family transcriptional regulator n=1 Tax=Paracoccus sp. S1E-3 TaxID=2756130 RepID=UPI0015EF1B91|nr:LysR family transcriptional regulator [Paracoccus sp. S1E-3]MBA4489800.1 LysR family transcriptional regulator [Paracoccus sp. S1E-3]
MVKTSSEPDWDDFRLVKAIAEARGMPGAAAELQISASTVFRRLGQIEDAMGVALFRRHRGGYELTPAGAEIVALAQRLESEITTSLRRVAEREVLLVGELRLVIDEALLHLLMPVLAYFLQQYRDIRLNVTTVDKRPDLSAHDANVVIFANGQPPDEMIGRRIARIAWALYGSVHEAGQHDVGDATTDRKAATPDPKEKSAPRRVAQTGSDRNVTADVVYRTNTILGVAEAVERGMGVGRLPCFVGDLRPGLVRHSAPEFDATTDLWLLTCPDMGRSARVRLFVDFVAARIIRHRPLFEGEGV